MPVAALRGRGEMDTLVLTAADGAHAELYLAGAHLTSWVPAGAAEQLFVSARSAYTPGTAIRGGVPVIFPQFGPGPIPRHGFARTSTWEVAAAGESPTGAARATLALRDSETTRRVWPFAFEAQLGVELLGQTITVSLGIGNPGPAPLTFTAALHTYVAVADIARATVEGLAGVPYRDQTRGNASVVDEAPGLTFEREVDRLYVRTPRELRLHDGRGPDARVVAIHADGFPDAVVWNPWAEKARALDDLADDEYQRFVCIEAAAAAEPVVVALGARWTGAQRLTLL